MAAAESHDSLERLACILPGADSTQPPQRLQRSQDLLERLAQVLPNLASESDSGSDVDLDAGIVQPGEHLPGGPGLDSGSDVDLDAGIVRPDEPDEADEPGRGSGRAEHAEQPVQDRLPTCPVSMDESEPGQARYNSLVSAWNGNIASNIGSTVRYTASGELQKQILGDNPRTRLLVSLERLAFAKHVGRRTHSSAQRAQALWWKTAESAAVSGVEQMFSALKDRPRGQGSWLTVSRRLDESSMFLRLNPDETATWIKWIFANLQADKYLDPADIEELADLLKGTERGLLHVLFQH